MGSYRERLERDLTRWREAGWISEAGYRAIEADLGTSVRTSRLPIALAVLGAVLLGFAAMSFVAANWQDMARLQRLGLLLVGLWLSYGVAAALMLRGLDSFAHAAILTGVGLFGASIMLIAQMYHIDGNPPDAVLLWAAGALLAGVLLRSNPSLGLAVLLISLWGGWETTLREAVFWEFLIGWLAVAVAMAWRRWAPGLHLCALVLAAWIVSLGHTLPHPPHHGLVALIGGIAAMAAAAVEIMAPRHKTIARAAFAYAIAVAMMGMLALQFAQRISVGHLTALAVLTLAAMLAALAWGTRSGHRGIIWIAYIGFSAEVLALYGKTIGTLLGTSLFFLVAGVIAVSLAAVAYRIHNRPLASSEI